MLLPFISLSTEHTCTRPAGDLCEQTHWQLGPVGGPENGLLHRPCCCCRVPSPKGQIGSCPLVMDEGGVCTCTHTKHAHTQNTHSNVSVALFPHDRTSLLHTPASPSSTRSFWRWVHNMYTRVLFALFCSLPLRFAGTWSMHCVCVCVFGLTQPCLLPSSFLLPVSVSALLLSTSFARSQMVRRKSRVISLSPLIAS